MSKFIAITGATRGIGLELSKRLAEAGESILITGRDSAKLSKLQEDLRQQYPKASVERGELDTASDASIHQFFAHLRVPLKTIVNNAAIFDRSGLWKPDVFNATIQTNVNGPITLMRKFAEHVKEKGIEGGRIVNVSSGLGTLSGISPYYQELVTKAETLEDLAKISFNPSDAVSAGDELSPYKIAKALLNKATIIFALDHPNIATSAVCPGWVKTDMGGSNAPGTVQQGADSVLWLVKHENMPSGGFFRYGNKIKW